MPSIPNLFARLAALLRSGPISSGDATRVQLVRGVGKLAWERRRSNSGDGYRSRPQGLREDDPWMAVFCWKVVPPRSASQVGDAERRRSVFPVLVLEDAKRVRVGLLREFVRGERHAKFVIGRTTFCSDGLQGLEIESVEFCGI